MANVRIRRDIVDPAELPTICLRCGGRPATLTPVRLPYIPESSGDKVASKSNEPMLHWAGDIGVMLFGGANILHGFRNGQRVSLWAPLCERHTRSAWWHSHGLPVASLSATILAVLFAILDVCTWHQGFLLHWAFGLAAITCFLLALLLRGHNHDGFLYPLNVTESDVELGGASEEFARELIDRRRLDC